MDTLNSIFKQTYFGKKVFLTGHTGFKGSWLLYWLRSLGAIVAGYALRPEQSESLYYAIEGDQLCNSIIADIRDKNRLEKEITEFQPDFIFHLAAQPLVRLSYAIPSDTFAINSIGTAYVLDAIRLLEKPCVGIFITTDKVYDNKEWIYPYRENEPLGGYDPYSASKACAELIISSYRNSFFNTQQYTKHYKAIASARAGNVIGGGDWAIDRIIPDIIKSFNNNVPVQVRNPFSVRPWEHVLEPLSGYLLLGSRLIEDPVKYSESWNFGPLAEDNKTVEELVQIALKTWGKGDYTTPVIKEQLHEATLLKLDINKATTLLNWRPKWSSEEAIYYTMNWYKKFYQGLNPRELIRADIESYNKT